MPVSDGQAVSAAVTNPAFIDAVVDDTALGKITLANTDVASGATILNTQRLQNRTATAAGVDEVAATGTAYTSTQRVGTGTNHQTAISALDTAFHPTTGHAHTGVVGDGPLITGSAISGNPLKGSFLQGTDFTTVAAPSTSTDVSIYLIGKTPSSSPAVQGVVVNAPTNKVIIKNWPNDDDYEDAFGNIVYGRVTFAALVWTLSYYSDIAGVETVFTMPTSSPVRWYYQELFNPLVNAPVYSEIATVPSDNTTSDVLQASTTQAGKTTLAAVTAAAVAAVGSAGTSNSIVANANHVHEGVHSVKALGNPEIKGDAELVAGSGISFSQLGNQITINASAGGAGLSAVRYVTAAGQTVANATATIIDFDTQQYDQQLNVTTGASWKFTVTRSAVYTVESLVTIETGGGWVAGEDARLALYKNNVFYTYLSGVDSQAAHASRIWIAGATDIYLVPADFIDVRLVQTSGAMVTLFADATANTISIRENTSGTGFSPDDVVTDEDGNVVVGEDGNIVLSG